MSNSSTVIRTNDQISISFRDSDEVSEIIFEDGEKIVHWLNQGEPTNVNDEVRIRTDKHSYNAKITAKETV